MFAGGCPEDGRWRKVSRGVGNAAPYGLPGNGRQRKPAPHPALRGHLPPRGKARVVVGGSGRSRRGEGTPPYGWGYGNAMGFTRTPVPGASRGRGRACPARGLAWAAFPFYPLTLPTSPPAYSRCCRRQNRWGRSAHRPHARFRRWIRSRGASGHRRSGPEGTGVCCRRNFSSAG